MQQNSKCSAYSDRDKTINHIISECIKFSAKRVQDLTKLCEEGDLLEIMQKI